MATRLGGRPGRTTTIRPTTLHTEGDTWGPESWGITAQHLTSAHPGRVRITGGETAEELGEAHAWIHSTEGGDHDALRPMPPDDRQQGHTLRAAPPRSPAGHRPPARRGGPALDDAGPRPAPGPALGVGTHLLTGSWTYLCGTTKGPGRRGTPDAEDVTCPACAAVMYPDAI